MDTQTQPTEYADGYRVAIAEARWSLQLHYTNIDTTKATARALLSASSLIVALIGALQVFNVAIQPQYQLIYNSLIFITMGLYLILIGCCVYAISPFQIVTPIKIDEPTLYKTYVHEGEEVERLASQLVSYINAVELNKPLVTQRDKLVQIASLILPAIVVLLLLLSLIPRTPLP